ncbi:hypothetical protein ES703_122260 [subsurface metagenome]
MLLYKILKMVGDHGVSVFPPEEQELPPIEVTAGEPMSDIINRIILKGYTNYDARLAVQAWAYTAKYDLNQAARGVRVFCEMCAAEIPLKHPPVEPITWGLITLVAVIAAVALGLYLWVTLDQELNVTFGSHPWAYVMMYQERLWQGEILNVGYRQMGYYEQGALFGAVVQSHDRGSSRVGGTDWIWFKPGSMVLEGRRILFYHVYRFSGFYLYFCGVMTKVGTGLYKLREGGRDTFKTRGPWSRPGGRMFTPEYEGCWGEWWWL